MKGFIAFSEERAYALEDKGKLAPEDFGYPNKWVPFAWNEMDALKKLSYMRPQDLGIEEASMERAQEYYILEMTFSAEHAKDAFMQHKIESWKWEGPSSRKGPAAKRIPGWRFYGVIDLSEVSHNWKVLSVPLIITEVQDKEPEQYEPDRKRYKWVPGEEAT